MDQPDHRRAAGAGARRRSQGSRRHGARAAARAAPACSRAEDWLRLAGIGLVMMVGTLAVLDAYYPGGLFTLFATGSGPNMADETYARTMAFTTLMMFQLFNVYNCRSAWRSAFSGFFENKWLIARGRAVAVHAHARDLRAVPADGVPHRAAVVRSTGWSRPAVAATLLIGMELVKLVLRQESRPARAEFAEARRRSSEA